MINTQAGDIKMQLMLGVVIAMLAGPVQAARFKSVKCPESVRAIAACHEVRDSKGAFVLAAMPKKWNQKLIVHAHGGPRLSAPKSLDSVEDLDRFSAFVRAGYAWVGSTYRRGGYGVRMAAADVERSRHLFVQWWSRPQRVILHGQSWGGNVVAKLAELHVFDGRGRPRYDAVLTTNGVLTGGTRAYGFRADLRVIWQYFCQNHPKSSEPQYPLWQGLPKDTTMSRDALNERIEECTGLSNESARTPEQAARLKQILAVSGVSEQQLASHLAWGTFHFQDLVQKRLSGRNPFDNRNTEYRGSADDKALNAGVQRFDAHPAALAKLGYDADLSGLIVLPTFNIHAAGDPVISPRALNAYAETIQHAGRSHLLAQVITNESDHSRLHDATYLSAIQLLERWLDTGARPSAAAMKEVCASSGNNPCDFAVP